MKIYKIEIFARMCFDIEAEDEGDANHKACNYVDKNLDEFDWEFDTIKEVKK